MQTTATITIRIEPELKAAFDTACTANDQTASQVLRAAIRAYVRENAQGELLKPTKTRKKAS